MQVSNVVERDLKVLVALSTVSNHIFRSLQLGLFVNYLIELLVYLIHQMKSGDTLKKWNLDFFSFDI